jgi:electron transport complex protein RnfG
VLYPAEIENQATHVTVYRARKAQQNTALAIKTHTNTGYNGRIRLLVGIDVQGTVLGVRALSHKETPGLGDKIDLRHSDWVLDFAGKTLNSGNDNAWKVRKDGGQFDQFTGATITPRAVVSAVKQSLILFETEQQAMFDMTSNCHLENTDE